MRARRRGEVATIRSLMAAVDNAEAAGGSPASSSGSSSSEDFAGTVSGVRAGDAPRRELDEAELHEILDAAIADRREHEAQYEALNRPDAAARMRLQAELMGRYRSNPAEP
jgi:uncharacterized protein YqeY